MGGASRYTFELALGVKDTHDVQIVAGGSGELFEQAKKAGIATVSIPNLARDISIFKEIQSFLFFVSLFKKEHPDVVHVNSPKVGGLGGLAARIAGVKKIIYTAHGWAFFEDRPHYQKLLIRFFSYVTVLLVTKVIAVSKKDAHAFDGWLFTKNKIIHIPNGVTLNAHVTHEEARTVLHSYDIPTRGMIVGTIAELHNNKGLTYLIEAAKDISDATFVVIGTGEEEDALRALVQKTNLGARFFFTGYIPNAARLISGFDIFVLPSLKEGLPYVLLEAGAQGVPVVASNVGGIPEIIEDGKSGLLVSAKKPSELKTAIGELLKDEEKRWLFSAALKTKIAEEFSLKGMIQKTVAVYSS